MSLGYAGNPPQGMYVGDRQVSLAYLGPTQIFGDDGGSLLLESGDDLLAESGDRILKES